MTLIMLVSWLAMFCAIGGRGLTASTSQRLRFWGFMSYVIGSVLWITYGIPNEQYALVTQNFILICFSFLGLKNNWSNKKSDV